MTPNETFVVDDTKNDKLRRLNGLSLRFGSALVVLALLALLPGGAEQTAEFRIPFSQLRISLLSFLVSPSAHAVFAAIATVIGITWAIKALRLVQAITSNR